MRDELVRIDRYAKWIGKPLSYVRMKLDQGHNNGVVLRGKEYIRLAKHRADFYRERERREKTD